MSDHAVPPALPPEFGVYFALLEVSALVQHGVEGQLRRDGGLSFVQFQILAICGEDPSSPRSMTDLADRLVHSKSGLTYQVDRLEARGLVARVPSPQDERGVNVTLSPKGSTVLQRVLPGHLEVVRDVLVDALDDAERDELTRLLGRVVQHMRSRPPRSASRAARNA
ncbi:MarR family winged helix-turn-helix transcriptional regulator [Agromyces ramosus]|uniref:DNA-binding MarR family transcriptional regulator n=1 Tax=Agromyces ramosus TaxID=33879 RepID=A0ABU0R5V4_9MICO|nr:MarR family winged helix-turn-helix transcriptional regulator [Agromyces ramosus]MDQ0893463.1 DNA-binding MarR family transcriptional regulator [Agromyces ramosus]